MQDIRKQFSLDWLSEPGSGSRSTTGLGKTALDEATLFYGGPILKALEAAPEGQLGLHELARSLKDQVPGFEFAALWKVVTNLVGESMIELVDTSDPTGNYVIRLGDRASSR